MESKVVEILNNIAAAIFFLSLIYLTFAVKSASMPPMDEYAKDKNNN